MVRKQDRQHGARAQQVLHFERVEVRVVGRAVVVEHEVDGVGGCAKKDDLENGEVELGELVERPQQVDVARYVDHQVEELRFKRDAVRTLLRLGHAPGE